MRRIAAIALLSLVACTTGETGIDLPPCSTSHPDVVLISLDTLRADHLGAYGYARETSPFLDAQADEGVVFENAWAPSPWTLPTHATLLSARLPDDHGAIDEEHPIGPHAAMLPEALGVLGYRRAAFVTAPFVGRRYGFDRGFDTFVDLSAEDVSSESDASPDAEQVTASALAWMAGQPAGDPAFLFLHFYDIHYPYAPPSPFDERFDPPAPVEDQRYENYFHYLERPLTDAQMRRQKNQYDEEIAYVDATLRAFCENWQRERPNTIFVVVSDHGEEFGERGSWGHGHTLTPEQLRVPWIVWGTGVRRARLAERVGLEDVAPTLAELAGTGFGPFDGNSRVAVMTGQETGEVPRGGLFATTSRRNTLRVRQHDSPHDLIVDLRTRAVAVYDIAADPGATEDLRNVPGIPLEDLWIRTRTSLGTPWEVRVPVTIETNGIFVLDDGRIEDTRLTLSPGRRFGVFPLDAELRVVEDGGEGERFRQIGGALPGADSPLILHGGRTPTELLELGDEEKERLRALGYAH